MNKTTKRPRLNRAYKGNLARARKRAFVDDLLEPAKISETEPYLRRFGLAPGDYLAAGHRARQAYEDETDTLWDALARHFSIDRSSRWWRRDLICELARQHDPDVLPSELFKQYGIAPYTPYPDEKLLLAMATTHVPAFRETPEMQRLPETRLSNVDMIDLVLANMKLGVGYPSASARLGVLLSGRRLKESLGPKIAERVNEILTKPSGNGDKLSKSWLKTFYADIASAPKVYRAGCANPIQRQWIEAALPILSGSPLFQVGSLRSSLPAIR